MTTKKDIIIKKFLQYEKEVKEIIDASILSSPYWPHFKKRYLFENMRVNGLLNSLTSNSTDEERKHVEEQKQYADFLVDLSKNRSSKQLNIIDSKLIIL